MNTPNTIASSCTKAHFYPKLESKKSKRSALQSEKLGFSFRDSKTSKVEKLEDFKKLGERAARSGINKNEVLEVFSCLEQVITMELPLTKKNIQILRKIVEKEYPAELKSLKVPVFFRLSCFIQLKGKNTECLQELTDLVTKSLNYINKNYEENPNIDELESAKKIFTMVLNNSENSDLQTTTLTEGENVNPKVQSNNFFVALFFLVLLMLYFIQFNK